MIPPDWASVRTGAAANARATTARTSADGTHDTRAVQRSRARVGTRAAPRALPGHRDDRTVWIQRASHAEGRRRRPLQRSSIRRPEPWPRLLARGAGACRGGIRATTGLISSSTGTPGSGRSLGITRRCLRTPRQARPSGRCHGAAGLAFGLYILREPCRARAPPEPQAVPGLRPHDRGGAVARLVEPPHDGTARRREPGHHPSGAAGRPSGGDDPGGSRRPPSPGRAPRPPPRPGVLPALLPSALRRSRATWRRSGPSCRRRRSARR